MGVPHRIGPAASGAGDRAGLAKVIPFPQGGSPEVVGRMSGVVAPIPAADVPVGVRRTFTEPSALVDDPPRVRSSDVRLTRRGRTVAAAIAGLVAGALTFLGYSFLPGVPAPTGPEVVQVIVEPGETVWEIAREMAPSTDVGVTVDRIAELNGLPAGHTPAAGDTLIVPIDNSHPR